MPEQTVDRQEREVPKPGTVIGPLEVGPVAHGGHFVARHQGRVVFVRHTLPGESITARLTDTSRQSYWLADAEEVVRPAPGRVAPPCPVAGECGGCDFQHVRLDVQRELKRQVIAEQLSRLAQLEPDVAVEPVPGDESGLHWRTRMRYHVDRSGSTPVVGLRAHRSLGVVPLPDQGCLIADARGPAPCRLVELAQAGSGDELVVATSSTQEVSVLLDGTPVQGRTLVTEHVGGRDFVVRADGFWQVHHGAAQTLTEAVVAMLQPRRGETALDLYCGVGTFAGALDTAGVRVTGVEASRAAIRLAERNVPRGRFLASRLESVLHRLPARTDLVVLDPPRSGAGKAAVRRIAQLAPRAICYVACDPAALARDLKTFAGLGYRVDELRAFDLFPMTHHVETVALLVKAGG